MRNFHTPKLGVEGSLSLDLRNMEQTGENKCSTIESSLVSSLTKDAGYSRIAKPDGIPWLR